MSQAAALRRRLRNTTRALNKSTRRVAREADKVEIRMAEQAELARGDELAATVRKAIPWALGAVGLGVVFVIWKRRQR